MSIYEQFKIKITLNFSSTFLHLNIKFILKHILISIFCFRDIAFYHDTL